MSSFCSNAAEPLFNCLLVAITYLDDGSRVYIVLLAIFKGYFGWLVQFIFMQTLANFIFVLANSISSAVISFSRMADRWWFYHMMKDFGCLKMISLTMIHFSHRCNIKTASYILSDINIEQQHFRQFLKSLTLNTWFCNESKCVWDGNYSWLKVQVPPQNLKTVCSWVIPKFRMKLWPTWIFTDWPTGRPSWIKILMWHWTSSSSPFIALYPYLYLSIVFGIHLVSH